MTEPLFPQTKRCRYSFKLRRFPDGGFWIAMDPVDCHLPHLEKGVMGFDLPEGISLERAKEIAEFLNDNLVMTNYTGG